MGEKGRRNTCKNIQTLPTEHVEDEGFLQEDDDAFELDHADNLEGTG
jgi:hypothetical protein